MFTGNKIERITPDPDPLRAIEQERITVFVNAAKFASFGNRINSGAVLRNSHRKNAGFRENIAKASNRENMKNAYLFLVHKKFAVHLVFPVVVD